MRKKGNTALIVASRKNNWLAKNGSPVCRRLSRGDKAGGKNPGRPMEEKPLEKVKSGKDRIQTRGRFDKNEKFWGNGQ